MVSDVSKFIREYDPAISRVLELELQRQRNNIELIASENIVSEQVISVVGSVLTNKYAEGYPGKRYYGGCEFVDIAENICIERAKLLFGATYANVQAHSGSQANYAVYQALCKPGDTVMGMDLNTGGHLTHGSPVNFSGKLYNIVPYSVNAQTECIDYDEVREIAKQCSPKMIVAGASAYPRSIDFKAFADIAHEVGAYLFVDMAHIAGLVAGGAHPSPIGYADVVSTTTHKTLRGPRGAMILTNDADIAKKINSAIFPGAQGGPLMHVIAAKAVALKEALKPEFQDYAKQIVKNAQALSKALLDGGINLVTGGTDNHLMLLNLMSTDLTGKELEKRLDSVRITANKNMVPNDTRKPQETSGLRIGTPAVTTRGFKEADCKLVGELIVKAITDFDANKSVIIEAVDSLIKKYPIY